MCLTASPLSFAECSDFSPPVTVILLIFLCLEGLLFFTFTAVMFGTQIHSICNDETVRPSSAGCVASVRWSGRAVDARAWCSPGGGRSSPHGP